MDDEDRMLAIRRRDNGHWEPPGGVLELDEPIFDGLVREVAEEAGLRVKPERLTGAYKNMVRGIVALVFRCRLVGGEASPSSEVSEVAWLSPAEARAVMSEAYSTRILDALADVPPKVRAHDGERLAKPMPSRPRRSRDPTDAPMRSRDPKECPNTMSDYDQAELLHLTGKGTQSRLLRRVDAIRHGPGSSRSRIRTRIA